MRGFLCFAVVFVPLCFCHAEIVTLEGANEVEINSVLVSVSGYPVTLGDVLFETWEAENRIYALADREEIPELIAGERRQKLEELIDRRLLIQEFDRLGHSVAPEYIEEALNMISRDMGCRTREELEVRAGDFHTDIHELRRMAEDRIKMEMIINGLVFKRANITPRQVAEYIKEHRDEFVEEEKIRFSILKLDVSRDDLSVAAKAVATSFVSDSSPENFTALAQKYSDWKREAGGDVGLVEKKRLRREFAAIFGGAPEEGRIYGPVDIEEDGIYYLLVSENISASEPDWSAVRREVARILEKEAENKILTEYLLELKKKAVIERQ